MSRIGLVLAFACLALSLVSTVVSAGGDSKWFVLIDAGSTGSRAHVHQYTRQEGKPLPLVEESINLKIKPGLSDCAANPASATEPMQKLLTFIRETVPKDQWSITPIHLQATAGLRSVTIAEADAILEVVRDELQASGFLFERTWARVISGEQEGINGWMAVNYLLGVFDAKSTHGEAPKSTGVVEMGGSSMQITFAPETPSKDDRKQLNEVVVAGNTYYLYTHSFLQYGLQAAEKLYQKLAMNDIEEKGNPCYPRAFRHSSVGNFDRCTQLLSKVVDKSIKCSTASCSFNGVYQPKIGSEEFLAIENFYYTAKFFGTHEQQNQNQATSKNSADAARTGNQVTTGLRAKGQEFCNKDWPVLLDEYKPKNTPANELSTFCFSAAYQSVVLESGLGFHPDANLRVAKTINGKGIDWEIGATIFELIGAGVEKDQKAAAANKRPIDIDPSLPLPITSRVRGGAETGSKFCKSCVLYTIVFAIGVALSYFGYVRYSKRSAVPMTSYSQSAFGRV